MLFEIVADYGETPNKCTIAPLAARPDFRVVRVHGEGKLGPLTAPLLLHHEGECLSRLRRDYPKPSALAAIDCVWRRLPHLVRKTDWVDGRQPTLAKVPDGFVTAYPRVGLQATDPDGGFATIEAVFIAAAMLGNPDLTLLSKYYFARRFIELNAARFADFGVGPFNVQSLHLPEKRPRNALTRRWNRGRGGDGHLRPEL
jgi:ribosome biogenesis protein Tsr3